MYLEYFRLRERPFSNVPDPRFVYLGAQHERALAHLLHGVRDQSGVVHLTGEHGLGKTTMCRVLLDRLPERVDVALILNPVLTPEELLAAVCDELGVKYAGDASSPTILIQALSRHLEARAGGRRTVLIVDEAQNLELDVLEQLRRLSSLEVDSQRLLQIILIGEPGLIEPLGRLWEPIVAGYHLLPLAEGETCAYVRHRLTIAGGTRDIFDVDALRDVHHLSSGVPRVINTVCDRALLSAAAQQRHRVDRLTVRAAARAALDPAGAPALEPVEAAPRVAPVVVVRKPVPRPVTRTRRRLWPWLVSGGLALNAAVIGAVLLVPHPTDVVPPPSAAVETIEAPPRVEPAVVPPEAARDDPGSARLATPVTPSAPAAVPAMPAPPATRVPPRAPGPAPALSTTPEPYPPQGDTRRRRRRQARGTGAATSPPVSAVEPQSATPDSAALKVDLLVWADDPQQRMVFLNGHKYVEGQTLADGAVIEQITPDGVVLLQRGQRIQLRSEAR